MKISTKAQKILLFNLFYEKKQTMQGEGFMPKEFPLEDLVDASNAKKKLTVRLETGNYNFEDGEVEFTADERNILKKLFDAKKNWTTEDADVVLELKELLK